MGSGKVNTPAITRPSYIPGKKRCQFGKNRVPEHLRDLEILSNGSLRRKYQSTYGSWRNVLYRAKQKGLPVDDVLRDFRGFIRVVGPRPSLRHSLDRRDNLGGYTVANVRWADPVTQNRNRSNTVSLTYCNQTRPLTEWAQITNQRPDTLRQRQARGWTDEQVIGGRAQPAARSDPVDPSRLPWPPGDETQWETRYQQEKNQMYSRYQGPEPRVAWFVRRCDEEVKRLAEVYGGHSTDEMTEDDRAKSEYAIELRAFAHRQMDRVTQLRAGRGRVPTPQGGWQAALMRLRDLTNLKESQDE